MRPQPMPDEVGAPGSVLPVIQRPDAELIDAIVDGDRGALETVYDQHGSRLYSLACSMCGPIAAEGILVAVLVDLWRDPGRFRGGQVGLGVLLSRDTHLRAVASLRNDETSRSPMLADFVGGRPGSRLSVDKVMLRRFVGEALADRILALPADEREVVVLAYFGGYGCQALATCLGRTQATITAQIRSGIEHLGSGLVGPETQ